MLPVVAMTRDAGKLRLRLPSFSRSSGSAGSASYRFGMVLTEKNVRNVDFPVFSSLCHRLKIIFEKSFCSTLPYCWDGSVMSSENRFFITII